MVPIVSYGILVEQFIYYRWGMHICEYMYYERKNELVFYRGMHGTHHT